jgi:hypothetical protein
MYFFGGRVIQPPRPNGTEKSIGSIGALGMTPAQAEKHLKGSHPATNTGHKRISNSRYRPSLPSNALFCSSDRGGLPHIAGSCTDFTEASQTHPARQADIRPLVDAENLASNAGRSSAGISLE